MRSQNQSCIMTVQQDQAMAGHPRPGSDETELDVRKPSTYPNPPFLLRLARVIWPLTLWFSPKVVAGRKYKDDFLEAVQPLNFIEGPLELGTFINADANYQIFRRFGLLRTWALLDLQNELNTIEQNFRDNPKDLDNKELMAIARDKLKEYGDLTEQQRLFNSLEQPNIQNHTGLLNWAKATGLGDPKDPKYNWLYHRDDLVIIPPDGGISKLSMFENFLLSLMMLVFTPDYIQKHFMNDYEQKLTSQLPGIARLWISSTHLLGIRHFVQISIITIGLALTLYPVAMLYFHVTDWGKWSKIGLIIGFTNLFALFLKVFTQAKTQDMMSYLSGYCALLVVFLGLSS